MPHGPNTSVPQRCSYAAAVQQRMPAGGMQRSAYMRRGPGSVAPLALSLLAGPVLMFCNCRPSSQVLKLQKVQEKKTAK
jgi:hypothetical protein